MPAALSAQDRQGQRKHQGQENSTGCDGQQWYLTQIRDLRRLLKNFGVGFRKDREHFEHKEGTRG